MMDKRPFVTFAASLLKVAAWLLLFFACAKFAQIWLGSG